MAAENLPPEVAEHIADAEERARGFERAAEDAAKRERREIKRRSAELAEEAERAAAAAGEQAETELARLRRVNDEEAAAQGRPPEDQPEADAQG